MPEISPPKFCGTLCLDNLPSHDLQLYFFGQIHNIPDLESELELPKKTVPISELLKKAYRKWKTDFPGHLLGEFSLVLLDSQKKRILCARDPMGVKPFYYRVHKPYFSFSSNIQDLTQAQDYKKEVHLEMLTYALLDSWHRQDLTVYKDIQRLPPGCTLEISPTAIKLKKYWDIEEGKEIHYEKQEAYAEELHEIVSQSVRCRIKEGQPKAGILLSGGFDSTALTFMARKHCQSLETFSMRFSTPGIDDRDALDSILSDAPWTHFTVDPEKRLSDLEVDDSAALIDVQYHPCHFIFKPMLEEASRRGIRTIASGLGGDDVFTFGSIATDLLQTGKWHTVYQILKKASNRPSHFAVFLMNAVKQGLPPSLLTGYRFLVPRQPPPWLRAEPSKKYEIFQNISHAFSARVKKFHSVARQEHYCRLFLSGAYSRGLENEQQFASTYNIEKTYPLLDRRILEFIFRVPIPMLCNGGWNKYLFRSAMRHEVPEPLLFRDNPQDFTPLLELAVKRQMPYIRSLFSNSRLASLGLVRENVIREFLKSKHIKDATLIVRLMYFERWLRTL